MPESAGNEDSVHAFQHFSNVRFEQLFAVDEVDVHVDAVGYARMMERFDDRQVSIWQARVLSDDGDIDLAVALGGSLHVILQRRSMQLAFGQFQPTQHLHVEFLLEKIDGHLVDTRRIDARQNRVDIDVAEMGDLRFYFVSGSDVGYEAHVHEHDVVYSQLMA